MLATETWNTHRSVFAEHVRKTDRQKWTPMFCCLVNYRDDERRGLDVGVIPVTLL